MIKVKRRQNIPWRTGEIRHILKKKETVRRNLKRSLSAYLQEKFKNFGVEVSNRLKDSRKKHLDNLEKFLIENPKRFWIL